MIWRKTPLVSFTVRTEKEIVMFQEIKKLADDALALQNKNVMDESLRKISALCGQLDSCPDENQAAYGQGLNLGSVDTKDNIASAAFKRVLGTVFGNVDAGNGGAK